MATGFLMLAAMFAVFARYDFEDWYMSGGAIRSRYFRDLCFHIAGVALFAACAVISFNI